MQISLHFNTGIDNKRSSMAVRPIRKDTQQTEYNSLKDANLGSFFARPSIFSHLLKMGLVTPRGKIVSEREWKNRTRLSNKPISSLDGDRGNFTPNRSFPHQVLTRTDASKEIVTKYKESYDFKQIFGQPETDIKMKYDSSDCASSGDDEKPESSDTGKENSDGKEEDTSSAKSRTSLECSLQQGDRGATNCARSTETHSIMSSLSSFRSSVFRTDQSSPRPQDLVQDFNSKMKKANKRRGLRMMARLRRSADVLPLSIPGEPYLRTLPSDTPVYPTHLSNDKVAERLFPRPASVFSAPDRILPEHDLRTGVTLHLQHTGRAAHLRLVQHPSSHTTVTLFSGDVTNNEEIRVSLVPFSPGCLGLVLVVDDIVSMRLNGCCERRYAPGAMLDGPGGRLRLVSVSPRLTPCNRCQSRQKRRSSMHTLGADRTYSSNHLAPESSKKVILNRKRSSSCDLLYEGNANPEPRRTFPIKGNQPSAGNKLESMFNAKFKNEDLAVPSQKAYMSKSLEKGPTAVTHSKFKYNCFLQCEANKRTAQREVPDVVNELLSKLSVEGNHSNKSGEKNECNESIVEVIGTEEVSSSSPASELEAGSESDVPEEVDEIMNDDVQDSSSVEEVRCSL